MATTGYTGELLPFIQILFVYPILHYIKGIDSPPLYSRCSVTQVRSCAEACLKFRQFANAHQR